MARSGLAVLVTSLGILAAHPLVAEAQIPTKFENLKVLPEDISRDSLVQLMRSFSFATGLRCEGCHVLGPDGSFQGARFDLDDKTNKRKARFMLRMVNRLNEEVLPRLPDRDDPPLAVECKTCHRGLQKPFLLRTELLRVVDSAGIDAAVARYRELRRTRMERGGYDFGQWEMNEVARQLDETGRPDDAVAMLRVNEEYHPDSPDIPIELGRIYEEEGRTKDALSAYRRALGRDSTNVFARRRLEALSG